MKRKLRPAKRTDRGFQADQFLNAGFLTKKKQVADIED